MNKPTVERMFRLQYATALLLATCDHPKREAMWTEFIDSLCKNGEITPRQFATWSTPHWVDPR